MGRSRKIQSALGIGLAATLVVLLGACSGGSELVCERHVQYQQAGTTDPLRIPDGLAVPDQSQSLNIPAVLPMSAEDRAAIEAGNCLEFSPAFATSE